MFLKDKDKIAEKRLIIGLEVHITVNSKKKIFNKGNTFWGKEVVNSLITPWELGYLGELPKINPDVIEKGIMLANIFKMKINKKIEFDRKIYNYFDLPKGYQITQNRKPLAENGEMIIIEDGKEKNIKIKSIHLEEDTAKSIYSNKKILLNFNRSGNPLIELVTEPIFKKIKDVKEFINNLSFVLRYLEISDAKMEEGRMRIDANFSLEIESKNRRKWMSPRYELKNFNSLDKIERAIENEMKNKEKDFYCNKKNDSEEELSDLTLNFDEKENKIKVSRKKEKYFYLPEINIPAILINDKEIEEMKEKSLEAPWIIWKKWNEKEEVDYNFFLKNIDLLKIFIIIENKNERNIKKKDFFKFYIENLFIFFKNKKMNVKKFNEKYDTFLYIFHLWKEKSESKEEIRILLTNLINDENFKLEIKKASKEENFDETKKIINDLWKYWEEEIRIQKKEGKRIKNFFLGKIREKFKIMTKKIVEEVNKIIEENE